MSIRFKKIELKVSAGSNIGCVMRDAIRTAAEYDVPVEFVFNDKLYRVNPSDLYSQVVDTTKM